MSKGALERRPQWSGSLGLFAERKRPEASTNACCYANARPSRRCCRLASINDLAGGTRDSLLHLFRIGQIDADWRDLFFEGLFVGAGLKEKSPLLLLRNRLVDNFSSPTKLTSTARIALAIKAWNALIEDRQIAMLKWSGKKEKFPKIEGLD